MDKVAIVILNYNGRSFLEKFLPQVVLYSQGAHIYVADNGSTDSSISYLQNIFPTVDVIRLEKNEGFCRGYNIALQGLDFEYYVLLNSDVEVSPGWLEPLVNLMDSNPDIGASQPKIKSYAEPDLFEHAGAAGGFIDKWGYPFCRGRVFGVLEKDEGQFNDIRPIFWATGACMIVRASLYLELEGLDEDFFAHMEEIDLCWRIQYAGYKIYYCGNSVVYHVGGGTLPKSNPRKTFFNFRNGLALLYKNLPLRQLYPTILIRLLLDGVAGLKFLLEGNPADFLAVIRAHFSFYGHLPQWNVKRKKTQARVKNRDVTGIYHKSIVFMHFVVGKKTFKALEE
jgi:GT2 family glycosyltransferase